MEFAITFFLEFEAVLMFLREKTMNFTKLTAHWINICDLKMYCWVAACTCEK